MIVVEYLWLLRNQKIPISDMGVAGIMVVNSLIFNYIPVRHSNGEYYLTSLMNDFLKNKDVYAVYGRQRPPFLSPDEIEKLILLLLNLFPNMISVIFPAFNEEEACANYTSDWCVSLIKLANLMKL